MIGLVAMLIAASQSPVPLASPSHELSKEERVAALHALGVRDADIERAQRAMGYVRCLYGTMEPNRIVGMPDAKAENLSFLTKRRAECAQARLESQSAFLELMSADTSLTDGERTSKVKSYFDGFDRKFEENVLRPEIAEDRRKVLKKCIEERGADNCL